MRTLRTAIAIVAAPLGCAALLAIAYHYTVSKDPTPDNIFNVWFFFALILLSVSLTAGVAIHISLYCLRRRTLPPYVAVGGLGGGLVAALFADMIHDTAFWMSPLDLPLWSTIVFLGVVAGTLTSGMFWLMRRPDRDAPSSRP